MSVKYGLSPSYRKQLGMPSQHSPTGGYLSRGTMFSLRSTQIKNNPDFPTHFVSAMRRGYSECTAQH